MKTATRARHRNGHRASTSSRSRETSGTSGEKGVGLVKGAVGLIGVPLLMKLLLRKSVLIAIGLGTVASWVVKRKLAARRRRRLFGLFKY